MINSLVVVLPLLPVMAKKGIENSNELIETLEKLNITRLFSSPYVRTLQTIYPYAKKTNKKIKLEYGLSEINHPELIPKNSFGIRLPEYIAEAFQFDNDYNTHIEPENLKYPETEEDVMKRIKDFILYFTKNDKSI